MKKEFVCINCPMGCRLTVSGESGALEISGYTCERGKTYAEAEVTNPTRTITALVSVIGRDKPLSVKTLTPVPKGMLLECAAAIKAASVMPPVKIGDIVIENLCDTGCAVAATENIE